MYIEVSLSMRKGTRPRPYPQPEHGTQQVLNKWLARGWMDARPGEKMWRTG